MSNTFTMPLGPVHVALEEPVYFHLTVEGETVRHVELTSGHVHRGMEAMATQRNLVKNVTLTERVCSLCSNSHSFTYSMVVENVLGVTIPDRACYLRVVAEEIKRIASHLFNTAIQAHIIGFKSLFMHVMEVREMMQDWDRRYPGRTEAVFTAPQNVVPSHLGDNQLFDFRGLTLDTPVSEGDIAFDSVEYPVFAAIPIQQPVVCTPSEP